VVVVVVVVVGLEELSLPGRVSVHTRAFVADNSRPVSENRVNSVFPSSNLAYPRNTFLNVQPEE